MGGDTEAVRTAWATALGTRNLKVRDIVNWVKVRERWSSPGIELLNEIAVVYRDESPTDIDEVSTDPADLWPSPEYQGNLLTDLNLRSYVNQRLADFFQLPYAASASRVPFRRYLYDRAVTVQHHLGTADALERRYGELAQGVKLRLPVFLAIALQDSSETSQLWAHFADLRLRAAKFRARRAELDAALARGDISEGSKVAKALTADVESILSIAGGTTMAVTSAVLSQVAKADVNQISLAVAAAEAIARQLVKSTLAKRLLWRLWRPDLLWLNDMADQAKHLTEALPDVARIWRLPERELDIFITRTRQMASLTG